MSRLTAILAGATGLVGGECLKGLLASRRYERVIVVARRELDQPARAGKLEQVVVDFEMQAGARHVDPHRSGRGMGPAAPFRILEEGSRHGASVRSISGRSLGLSAPR